MEKNSGPDHDVSRPLIQALQEIEVARVAREDRLREEAAVAQRERDAREDRFREITTSANATLMQALAVLIGKAK